MHLRSIRPRRLYLERTGCCLCRSCPERTDHRGKLRQGCNRLCFLQPGSVHRTHRSLCPRLASTDHLGSPDPTGSNQDGVHKRLPVRTCCKHSLLRSHYQQHIPYTGSPHKVRPSLYSARPCHSWGMMDRNQRPRRPQGMLRESIGFVVSYWPCSFLSPGSIAPGCA